MEDIKDKNVIAYIVPSCLVITAVICTGSGISYCIGLLPLLLLCSVYAVCIKECKIKELLCRATKKELILFLAVTFFYMVCIFGIVIRENFVCYWDYGAYWYWSLEGVQKVLFSNPGKALADLYISMNTQEYNMLLAWLAAIPLKLLGNSYLAFVLLVAAMFLIPALMLLSLFIWEINKKYQVERKARLSFIQIYLMVLSITVPLFPVLSGYIDVAALIPLLLCYMVTLKTEYAEMIEWKKCTLNGILLVIALLMRRYFGYAAVGYVFFLFGYVLFGDGFRNWKCGLKIKIVNIVITGMTSMGILVLFFRGFVIQSLFNNYEEAYAAYNMHDLVDKWKAFCLYFGLTVIFLVVCSVICAWKNKIIYFSFFSILSIGISMMLFYHIQDPGVHHYYIAAVPMITLTVLGYEMLHGMIAKSSYKKCICVLEAVVVGICALNYGFSLGMLPSVENRALFIQKTFVPRVRGDRASLLLMESEFERLDAQGFQGVYVVASSDVLNSDILFKLDAPSFEKKYQLCAVTHIDLSDGFNTEFFDADVIVDCCPLQVHLSPEGQSVISLLHDLFSGDEGGDFKKKYKMTNVYDLDGGVQAYIYVKQQELEKSDVEYVRDLYEKRYSDYPQLFKDRFDEYILSKF